MPGTRATKAPVVVRLIYAACLAVATAVHLAFQFQDRRVRRRP